MPLGYTKYINPDNTCLKDILHPELQKDGHVIDVSGIKKLLDEMVSGIICSYIRPV